MSVLPIVFTCDNNYFKYACVVIGSIICNNNIHTNYEINIVSEYISEENKGLAEKMIAQHSNFSIKYHLITIENPEIYHLNSYMSLSTYYRFFLFELMENYDRVLYLDSDIIVDDDISFFATLDFDDKAAVAVPSIFIQNILTKNEAHTFTRNYFKDVLKMRDFKDYLNAGVILFNLKLIREKNIDRQFFEALNFIKNPIFQDQDIVNAVLYNNGGVKMISEKYNYTKGLKISLKRLFLNAIKHQMGRKRNTWFSIYHFVGPQKPWQKFLPNSSLFFYYAYKTPFISQINRNNSKVLNPFLKFQYWLLSKF